MDFFEWMDTTDFLTSANFFWNLIMELVGVIASTTPEEFSTTAWYYTKVLIMNWTLTLGSSLFSSFYLINMLRQTANLKQGITAERFVEISITVILGNYAMLYGINLMNLIFDITGTISEAFMIESRPTFAPLSPETGTFYNALVHLIYMAVTLVCGFTILFVVYSRYLNLYLLVGVAPMAWSTIPGGHGISSTATAWLRTFLAKSFEIVIIVFAINIASRMCMGINLAVFGNATGLAGGTIQILNNMLTMIILTGGVKGAEMFMHRTFNL